MEPELVSGTSSEFRPFLPIRIPSSISSKILAVQSHVIDVDAFTCHQCKRQFRHRNSLRKHESSCRQKPRFECPYCEYRSKRDSNIHRHIRALHPDRQVWAIDLRAKETAVPPNPIKMEEVAHHLPTIYTCDQCLSEYKSRRSFLRHINHECGRGPKYGCPYCEFRSKQSQNVCAHIRGRHKECMVRFLTMGDE